MAATVFKTAVPSMMRMLMRPNATGIIVTSVQRVMSMPKIADISDSNHEHCEEQAQDQFPTEESNKIFMETAGGSLKINLEQISNILQSDVIEQLGPFLQTTDEEEKISKVTFNYLDEDIYRNILYMAFRRLGYEGKFTRYNHDKGQATFNLIDSEVPILKYSYFRSGQPNLC